MLELFGLASEGQAGGLQRRDVHPHVGMGKSYHGLTPCFSSKECLAITAWAGRQGRDWARMLRMMWRC